MKKEKNKSHTSRRYIFFQRKCLSLICCPLLFSCASNTANYVYPDYYRNKSLFYVKMIDLGNEKNSFHFSNKIMPKIKCYSPYQAGNEYTIIEGRRLMDCNDMPTDFFFFEIDSIYNVFSIDIYVIESGKICLTSNPPLLTSPKNFLLYNFYFSSAGYYYYYDQCYWDDCNFSVTDFCSIILSKYDKNLKDNIFGCYCYPNIFNSFYRTINNCEDLDTIRCTQGTLSGKTCKESIEIIKNDFENLLK